MPEPIPAEAAVRFSLIRQWAEAAAFFVTGLVATAVAVPRALARTEREVDRG